MERSRGLLQFLPRQLQQRTASPWRVLSQMEEEMQRWLDESGSSAMESIRGVDFVPQCDLRETKKEYIAQFDIPGVRKEDLKIEVEGNRLTVRGERKAEKEEKDEKRYYAESYYGTFLRTFALPSEIAEERVDAHYDNGVLTIKIPKTEVSSKTREVEIH